MDSHFKRFPILNISRFMDSRFKRFPIFKIPCSLFPVPRSSFPIPIPGFSKRVYYFHFQSIFSVYVWPLARNELLRVWRLCLSSFT